MGTLSAQKKFCTKCLVKKPVTDFHRQFGKRSGLRSHCKICRKAEKLEYRKSNKRKISISDARYRKVNRHLLTKRQHAWRIANPERYLEIHRKWKQANVDTCRATAQRRYAKKKGNGGSFTAAEWAAIKLAQDYTCLMCDRREPEIVLTIDHIHPICEGGLNMVANLQGLCRSCNSKKYCRTLDLRRNPVIF